MIKKDFNKKYIVFVGSIPKSALKNISSYIIEKNKQWEIVVFKDKKNGVETDIDFLVDFDNPKDIKKAFKTLGTENILSVTARAEKNIPLYKKILPYIPKHVYKSSKKSLEVSIDKTLMRKEFQKKCPKLNPKFKVIQKVNSRVVNEVCNEIGFPLMIKPAGLSSSSLVSSAYYKEELENGLKNIFQKIEKIYKEKNGRGKPTVLVEQMIDGDIYSVDVHINNNGEFFFNPFVEYTTARQKGFDDFFLYERTIPCDLEKSQVDSAKKVAVKGLKALGLKNITAHVELVNKGTRWKIIEIGPRVGGFRSVLYKKTFNIDIDINDFLIKTDKKIRIPKKQVGNMTTIQFYPKKEGYIKKIEGINKIKKLDSFYSFTQKNKKGQKAVWSKNGGSAVVTITLFNSDYEKFIEDKRKVEKTIKIETVKSKKKLIVK